MLTAMKLYLLFAVLFLAFMLTLVMAQAPKLTTTPTPTPASTPAVAPTDPLALTDPEIRLGQILNEQAQPILNEMQSAYNEMMAAKSRQERYAACDRHVLAALQYEPIRVKLQEWLKTLQDKHKCPDCGLSNNRLVPKPVPTPTPVAK